MATMAPIPGLRDPADFDTTRRDVYSAVLDGVRTKYPLENDTHRLELADVDYDGPEMVPLKEQKQALLKRKSLYRPIKGTWRLVDKATGAVLDQKRTTVVRVPMLTQRGTYILNGSEYSVAHQMRLRPGVYVRRKENGEHEAHFNVVKGGTSFRLLLEPKTGLFRLNIGQGSVPAYPVLKEAGVADDVIRQALGDDLFKVNANKRVTESQINKAWSRLVGARAAKETGAMGLKRNFREAFEKMEMDPEVTGFTLGEPATKVAPETILKAASKLLKVSRGEAETDDRDSLAYQETLGPDDLLRERIIKDSGRVGARLLWRSTLRKNLAGIPGGALDPQMKAVFFGSGLGNALEEINPLDALDQAYRVTRMGEGGLSDTSTIPDDARAVQPSQFLFIDPIRTTESTHIGVDLRLARNTRKGSDRAMYTKLRDAKTGEEVWLPPQVMTRATIALPGARRYAEKDGQKRVAAIRGGKLVYVEPDKLEFEASSQSDMFNPMSNLLPAINSMKGGRVLMASKWFIQAMPLKEREAPLVQVDSGDGTPAELQVGSRVGAVRASKGGVVEKLTPDEVVIRHADGTTTTQDLYNNFLFNRKSHIHNTPQVRKGDVVTPGQLLATSNYTDSQGGLAMGRNLRLGYMAHKDSVYEDAVLLSEAAANKLATERLYTEKADFDNMTETGTNKYISLFPATYTRSQLDKLDDSGVVRPGTILEKGDPIMLAVRQRTPKGAGMLYRGSKSRWTDASRTWDHDFQGEVTDTWQDDDGMKVAIKAYAPVEAGDKVVLRHGSKGVVSRVLPDGQMPVAPDGRPLEIILNPQGLITRCYDADTEFLTARGWLRGDAVQPADMLTCYEPATRELRQLPQLSPMHVALYTGELIRYKNKVMDFCVTPNHRMWVRPEHPRGEWGERRASDIAGSRYYLPVAGHAAGGVRSDFELPAIPRNGPKDTAWSDARVRIDAGDWAEFLGWYMAEGNTTYNEVTPEYRVHIAQSITANPAKVFKIAELLRRLPYKWNYSRKNTQFHISSKRLAAYLKQFGLGHEKYVPEWVYGQPYDVRARFIQAYWDGDGSVRRNPGGSIVDTAGTTSRRLADDLQRLLILQGFSSAVYWRKEREGCRDAWTVTRSSAQVRLTRKGWSRVAYSGRVYCPNVQTGYVVTRRNGRVLIAGNSNPSQVIEALLGKVAERKGKPYVLPQEYDGDRLQYALDELKKEGVPETDDLYDPMTGRQIKGVTTGLSYFMALHHQAESKESGRGTGSYTAEGMPTSGEDDENPKRIGSGEMAALVAHGAPAVIREVKTVRGQRNDDYWNAIAMGYPPPAPGVPQIYNKFMDSLKAAGINIRDSNGRLHLAAMTDADVDKLAAGEITEPATIKWLANFERGAYGEASPEPVPGGLFDRGITGGHGGNRFGFIRLPEPMPNPAFEDQIKRILGLTTGKFENVLAGREEIEGIGTGPTALHEALRRIKPEEEMERLRGQYRVTSSATARDELLKRMRHLDGVMSQGIKPADLMITKVPVLPPVFRPVNVNSKFSAIASPNVLYMDLLNANKNFKELQTQVTGEPVSDARMAVYGSLKAVTGMGDPIKASRKKQNVRGILDEVFGAAGPKTSLVQRSLIGGTTDLAGRGVITPDPNLDMDHIGIPENMAWPMYGRYAVRALSRQMGDSPDSRMKAVRLVADRDPRAKQALLSVMKDHPVMASRAPALHKFSIMGFEPVLVPGKTIRLSPGLCETFGADFDGDRQIGKVIALFDLRELNCVDISRNKMIDYTSKWCRIPDMKIKNIRLPAYNVTTHAAFVLDLDDFPHGALACSVVGEKGPIEFYAAVPGTRVLAYDEATGCAAWADVSFYSRHVQRDTEIVHLCNGSQIITDDDPRAVYGIPADGACECLRFTPSDAARRAVAVPVIHDADTAMAQCDTCGPRCRNSGGETLSLDSGVGYWLGAVAGDGWWNKKSYGDGVAGWVWNLADSRGYVVSRVKEIVTTLFPDTRWYAKGMKKDDIQGRYGDTVKHTAVSAQYGKDICCFLSSSLGGERDEHTAGSGNKRLPSFAFFAPREFREGMLCGLIDTDGSVSVSNAKGKPQLLVSFTSTSLRLCRDVRFLCRTLGIGASVGFAKNTSNGNSAWIVSISAVDCKRENALVGLETPSKRDAFLLTPVDESSPAAISQDMVPFPAAVKELIVADISPARAAADATQAEKDVANARMTPVLAAYRAVKVNLITRYSARQLIAGMEQRKQERERDRSRAISALSRAPGTFSREDGLAVSKGIRAVSEKWWLDRHGHAAANKLMQAATRCGRAGRMSENVIKQCMDLLLSATACSALYADCVIRWTRIVKEPSVRWTGIDRVEYTGVKEDGYDLTVPGYETFMDEQGIVLSNTMNVHAVVTSDAAKEVRERMLPSRNVRSPADFGPLFTPRHEFLYGLYAASSRRRTDKLPTPFKRASDALAAFKRGELDIDDEVEIVE